ncbi:MAG: two-component system, cell cycle response regulator [Gaiellaceae bacterium]|jgi:diguanylate cyclase (GGDEF)-like protein|nr:two-component system, cell cycle response regulator [Gaiellaceae bacterium]
MFKRDNTKRRLEARVRELEAERERLRDAIAGFGEALAATHDTELLQRVIVETAVEAVGAKGGLLVPSSGAIFQVGDLSGEQRLQLPLTASRQSFGTLILVGDRFPTEDRLTATSFAAHAVVALENARLHRVVERQALIDGLTGLANRRQSEDALATEISRAARFDNALTVVMADLDDFKALNDRYGHPAGDAVLRAFAGILEETLRDADLAGRWGGEEFLLLLPGTDNEGGTLLAERIRATLAGRAILTPDGRAAHVTASFGLATLLPGMTEAQLVASADAALYAAKRGGKDRVESTPEPAAHA